MTRHWHSLDDRDQSVYQATSAFLESRLEERRTINWALALSGGDWPQRRAIIDLLRGTTDRPLIEPWRTAWSLIADSWTQPFAEEPGSTAARQAQARIDAGDSSSDLIDSIVKRVAPRLKVARLSERYWNDSQEPTEPKGVEDLFLASLTSGPQIDPKVLKLSEVSDPGFALALANALEDAVVRGLDVARRLGWDGETTSWRLGQIKRVYYVPADHYHADDEEPDRFSSGVSPATKLLHLVVSRLFEIDKRGAMEFVEKWRACLDPIRTRLWAALARDPAIAHHSTVVSFLQSRSNRQYWDVGEFPEIAELRARRFRDMSVTAQKRVANRIRRLPPKNLWARDFPSSALDDARHHWAARELQRIRAAGAALPAEDEAWLAERIVRFPDLSAMTQVDHGFPESIRVESVPDTPDRRFDSLTGLQRLTALEGALGSTRSSWRDDPAKGAEDWINQAGNADKLVDDFYAAGDRAGEAPRVWERFGWAHQPSDQRPDGAKQRLASRLMDSLHTLPDATTLQAVSGITTWISNWAACVWRDPNTMAVWERLWPVSVTATNNDPRTEGRTDLDTVIESSSSSEPMDLDTLNTPTGKMVGLFLAGLPKLHAEPTPFATNPDLARMRDDIANAPGHSGRITRHRLIAELPYFLAADDRWTREHLVEPLLSDSSESVALWRAVALRTRYHEVLKVIGASMAERAPDRGLGRESQGSLIFSLVVESLHSLRLSRTPAVSHARVQQVLRSLDGEARVHAAGSVSQFLREMAAGAPSDPALSPEAIFDSAVEPFLKEVWPQEQSLSTPGVSKSLVEIPAASGDRFSAAVAAIERFIVPFDCWSSLEYGLYGDTDGQPKIRQVDSKDKAKALLTLLDLSIGTSDRAVVPFDLPDLLDHVESVASDLATTSTFRRLAALAR